MTAKFLEEAVEQADTTDEIAFGHHSVAKTGEVFACEFPSKSCIIVADVNTWEAAGEPALASLKDAGVEVVEPYIFPGTPTVYAGYDNVQVVEAALAEHPEAVACSIGGGTMNDLVKLASSELGQPYMHVCTAASVDGYAAFGASIAKDGFKITRNCAAPVAVVADLDIMADAPKRLTATGYGDLIEKIPAGADWILADELGIEPIDGRAWRLVQGPLKAALAHPEELDNGQIAGLAEENLLSGLAMQITQSSRPASGAGHLFSHVWEMEGHGQDWEPPLSHGFKVGVGTVASCALWEEALKLDLSRIDIDGLVVSAASEEELIANARTALKPRIFDEAVKNLLAKSLHGDELRERLLALQSRWPKIVERTRDQLYSPEKIADMLATAGAPWHPAQIGIDKERFIGTFYKAQMIRNRYTILDALVELGVFGELVDRLFAPGGFYAEHPCRD
ncbi:MAG: sn-glycerol-1-phosphate dehydrogenase [Propionibacteriaceae bacterium]|jgi:glycerol-1-phosphate dehydrogenase [NAD(P)+]|nr:sn-glycerol-1-phosphate dehydrogenase [Propionibacteriaceae bacterium]